MTQQKKRLKPTLILALDPFAAAFCSEVERRLRRDFGDRGSLIQTRALALRGGRLVLDSDLPDPGDAGFNLREAREVAGRPTAAEAEQLFESEADTIGHELMRTLSAGLDLLDLERAERDGYKVVEERIIYLVLSSVEPLAVGAALGAARLVKWLFANRFADELYTLHALVLLPDLFENPGPPDYAATFALLKRLDAAFSGLDNEALQGETPFDSCWLMDGRNARAVRTNTLAENLSGYADAFAGFLRAEPEQSGAQPGHTARGRPPVYSTFGFGELYFPTDEAVKRLSATLAEGVTRRGFLGEGAAPQFNSRQMLLAAKQFVSGDRFGETLRELERHKGLAVWRQDFSPALEPSEINPGSYIAELLRRHEEFERVKLLEYRNALLESAGPVQEALVRLLDEQIDGRANGAHSGLADALSYLQVLIEPAIALRQHLIGAEPQNLITALHAVEGDLDGRLGVEPARQRTQALLERVNDLRGRLDALQTDLRVLPVSEPQDEPFHPAEQFRPPAGPAAQQPPQQEDDDIPGRQSSEGEPPADKGEAEPEPAEPEPPPRESPRRRLEREAEEVSRELQYLSYEYRDAEAEEDSVADAMRREGMKRGLVGKGERIAQVESELSTTAEQARAARRTLDDLLILKQEYMRRHFILHPMLAATVGFIVPLLAAVGDIGPAREVFYFFWERLFETVLGFVLVALVYTVAVLFVLWRGLQQQISKAREDVQMLASQFAAAASRLRHARNDLLRFKHDLSAQSMRINVLTYLVETTRLRIRELNDTLVWLGEVADDFSRRRAEAQPTSSVMRRPLLQVEDIDAYYARAVTDIEPEIIAFTHDHVRRSHVRLKPREEFTAELTTFALRRFSHLARLTIHDALLRRQQPELLPEAVVRHRLMELNDAAAPLLRLRQTDASAQGFAERDATLWAGPDDHERVLELFREVCPKVEDQVGDNDLNLRLLTRCLHFPAYFIGPVKYYRDYYEREPHKYVADLPDVLPEDERVKRVHENILLALATGLIARRADGQYAFVEDGGDPLGSDRRQIAERFVTNFGARRLSAEFDTRLKEHLMKLTNQNATGQKIYERLNGLLNTATDLDASERGIIIGLTSRYF